jgi:hypothetical protein
MHKNKITMPYSKTDKNVWKFTRKFIICSTIGDFYWGGKELGWTNSKKDAKKYATEGVAIRAANELFNSYIKEVGVI